MRRLALSQILVAPALLVLSLLHGPPVWAQSVEDPPRDAPVVAPSSARPPSDETVGPYGPAVWMRIPRIDVDSPISEVGIENGEYGVPWFEVGRHVDSVQPGAVGNSVYNGHVNTVNAGRVFARLHELGPGDAIYIYTPTVRLGWVVTETFTVPNWENDFLRPSEHPQVTLYTCTGAFNPLEQNFADRLVVVAWHAEIAPLQ